MDAGDKFFMCGCERTLRPNEYHAYHQWKGDQCCCNKCDDARPKWGNPIHFHRHSNFQALCDKHLEEWKKEMIPKTF